jgi:hypothetical protein
LFDLYWTTEAEKNFNALKQDPSQKQRHKAVKKTIKLLASNPHHNSLRTHEYSSIRGFKGEKVFEAYAQNKTPAAYRVFWHYGPGKDSITIVAITAHP